MRTSLTRPDVRLESLTYVLAGKRVAHCSIPAGDATMALLDIMKAIDRCQGPNDG